LKLEIAISDHKTYQPGGFLGQSKTIKRFAIFLVSMGMISTGYSNDKRPAVPDSLVQASQRELQDVLKKQSEWVKVHAAEYLLWAGIGDGVREEFLAEEKQFGQQALYRIGIWRVLAQAAPTEPEREKWISLIQQAFQDTIGPDRIHAAETLAKLRVPPASYTAGLTRQAIDSNNPALSLYTRWSAAFYSSDSLSGTRQYFLDGIGNKKNGAIFRRMGAYILRHLGALSRSQWTHLAQMALSELESSDARTYLLSAAFVKAPAEEESSKSFNTVREKLLRARIAPSKGDRSEMAMALAERGELRDLPVLIALLKNQNPLFFPKDISPEKRQLDADNADVRAAAAYAILKIQARNK